MPRVWGFCPMQQGPRAKTMVSGPPEAPELPEAGSFALHG